MGEVGERGEYGKRGWEEAGGGGGCARTHK